MKKKYEGIARVRRSTFEALMRGFETFKMNVSESVTGCFATVVYLPNKMRTYGESMSDIMI